MILVMKEIHEAILSLSKWERFTFSITFRNFTFSFLLSTDLRAIKADGSTSLGPHHVQWLVPMPRHPAATSGLPPKAKQTATLISLVGAKVSIKLMVHENISINIWFYSFSH